MDISCGKDRSDQVSSNQIISCHVRQCLTRFITSNSLTSKRDIFRGKIGQLWSIGRGAEEHVHTIGTTLENPFEKGRAAFQIVDHRLLQFLGEVKRCYGGILE